MSQQQDDDGTVIRPRTVASAFPSTATAPHQFGDAEPVDDADDVLSLRIGARLGEFEILRRLGTGGFSIVYLARDHSLERTVALKEYLPSSLATRVGATQVQPRAQHRDTFEVGLKSFINEAKLLASFDHPSLVKVYRFWEANGTAYMVMPFYQGQTLKDTVRAMPEPPDEAWLKGLLAPLTEALMVIHADHCFHRDIAPDNVILLEGHTKPLLLDFGAARRVIGDMTHGLTVILKAGYAPVEQYAEIPGMKQGSWTDVYALAALVHWAIVGNTPPPSVGRMLSDSFVPLAQRAAGRYSARFLQAIDRALVVLPDKRTPTIEALRRDLGIGAGDAAGHAQPEPLDDLDDATVIRPIGYRGPPKIAAPREPSVLPARPTELGRQPQTATIGQPEVRRTQAGADSAPRRTQALDAATRPAATSAGAQRKAGSRLPMIAALVVVAAVAGAGLWWALRSPSAQPAVAAKTPPATVPSEAPTTLPQASTDSTAGAPANPGTQSTAPAAESAKPDAAPRAPDEPQSPPPVAPAAPPQGIPDKPPARTEKKPAPPDAGAPIERATKRPSQGTDAAAPTAPGADNRAECARIVQRLSLGESNPELLERLKTLKCR